MTRVNRLAGRLLWTPDFRRRYMWLGVVALAATTLLWAILGARLQQNNADQLANPLLFEHVRTLHQAQQTGAHSFLFKWPFFWFISLLGFSDGAYVTVTVLFVLATVGGLAWLLYRIDRRPLVFGTFCLALASCLLLVPPQPYAGALLPVNMAMLTTRNVEYLFYLAGLGLFIRVRGFKDRSFWLGVLCLGILAASDKLFLDFSLGGAGLALVVYALLQNWKLVSLAVNWLVGSLLAGIVGTVLLGLVQALGISNVSGKASDGPFGMVHGLHGLALGIFYGLSGLFTNFGANPAYDGTVAGHIPHLLLKRLFGWGGPGYLIDAAVLVLALASAGRLVGVSLRSHRTAKLDGATSLSLMLIWSAIAAAGLFVMSNHYYAVDARYLGIVLFAGLVAAATRFRRRAWRAEQIIGIGAILIVGVACGVIAAINTYENQRDALANTRDRNQAVSQVLHQHPTQVLVGDYWRVIPIKAANVAQTVTPLDACTEPRSILSSAAWQPNLHSHSFAYLLSLDHGLTNYPPCSLNQVIKAYGRPNTSALVAGSLKQPQELVLFYDHGASHSAPKVSLTKTPATVLPIAPDELPYTTCTGPTIMQFVAHQDDDLLFMNPTLLHDIKAGRCVRTVYLTAGDGGNGHYYWLGREQGSEAAYSSMLGYKGIWVDRIVELGPHTYATIANPKGNSKVSLIFMHLPDGNMKGEGFPSSHDESLAKLDAGKLSQMHSVDSQSTYTAAQLQASLAELMHLYLPAEIRTQANFVSTKYPDHSDHMAVGRFVKRAYVQYEREQYAGLVNIPLQFYIGYPIHERPTNVADGDLQAKESAFLAYANFDRGVCHTVQQCSQNPAYGAYLPRQYQNNY